MDADTTNKLYACRDKCQGKNYEGNPTICELSLFKLHKKMLL